MYPSIPAGQRFAAMRLPPSSPQPRYWTARVGERQLSYPVEDDSPQLDWHDGVMRAEGQMTADATQRVIGMLTSLPHGVDAMCLDVPGLVETSCNQ